MREIKLDIYFASALPYKIAFTEHPNKAKKKYSLQT
jgi:hypothetical protein